MTKLEVSIFENMLSSAFAGGEHPARELRLSQDEVSYLCAQYPHAALTALADNTDEKAWYQITLLSPTA